LARSSEYGLAILQFFLFQLFKVIVVQTIRNLVAPDQQNRGSARVERIQGAKV
jgi:hypothetical protein